MKNISRELKIIYNRKFNIKVIKNKYVSYFPTSNIFILSLSGPNETALFLSSIIVKLKVVKKMVLKIECCSNWIRLKGRIVLSQKRIKQQFLRTFGHLWSRIF